MKVCSLTPAKRHWLPTREAWIKEHLKDKPDNLVIRFSAPMVNQRAPESWPNSFRSGDSWRDCPAQSKTTNAETVGHAGTLQLKLLNTVNIEMFRHPKYYKELRKRNKLDQAISKEPATAGRISVRLVQAPSNKLQATSSKEPQASSDKHQAPSNKLQA